MDVWNLMTLIIFGLSLPGSLFIVWYKKSIKDLWTLLPVVFLLFFGMHVIPFGVNCSINIEQGKQIYENFSQFKEAIPYSLLLSALFVLIFSSMYRYLVMPYLTKKLNRSNPNRSNTITSLSNLDKWVLGGLFLISLVFLELLGKGIGGIYGLLLKGYGVTEVLIGKGHLANAFDWLCGIMLLFMADAFRKKSPWQKNVWIGALILLIIAFAIMGRRAVIICIYMAFLFLYHFLYKNMGLIKLIAFSICMFLFLNILGLSRGSDYQNIGDFANRIVVKIENYIYPNCHKEKEKEEEKESEGKWKDMIYVFTTGQFAQPYQCFPHIIERKGKDFEYGYGKYHAQQFALIVPNALWKNRPLSMAQWYATSYRGTEKLNEGILFLNLSIAYMDFGIFGILLYGCLMPLLIGLMVFLVKRWPTVLCYAIVSILIGNMFSFIVGDFITAFIVLSKGMLFPALVLLCIHAIRYGINKIKRANE